MGQQYLHHNIDSWAEATLQKFLQDFRKKYPAVHPGSPPGLAQEIYQAPSGYNDSFDHLKNFFAAVRSRQPVVEDPVFGFRAAGAALLANESFERRSVVDWDPREMKLL